MRYPAKFLRQLRLFRSILNTVLWQTVYSTRLLEDAAAAGKVLWSQDPWTGLYRIQP